MNKEKFKFKEDDVKTVEKFEKKIHKLSEYMQTNPDNKSLEEMQDIYLDFLSINIKFMEIYKYKYPDVFKFMKKEEKGN